MMCEHLKNVSTHDETTTCHSCKTILFSSHEYYYDYRIVDKLNIKFLFINNNVPTTYLRHVFRLDNIIFYVLPTPNRRVQIITMSV